MLIRYFTNGEVGGQIEAFRPVPAKVLALRVANQLNADSVLQEHNLKLIRSAATLTVSGEFEEPLYEELEEDYLEDDDVEFANLVSFNVKDDKYEILMPIYPFFILGELRGEGAFLLDEDDEERIGPLVEAEYEKSLV